MTRLFIENKTLCKIWLNGGCVAEAFEQRDCSEFREMIDAFRGNNLVAQLLFPGFEDEDDESEISKIILRNRRRQFKRIKPKLVDFLLAMIPLRVFPAYVLLEIFDFLPDCGFCSHAKKIALIVDVKRKYDQWKGLI